MIESILGFRIPYFCQCALDYLYPVSLIMMTHTVFLLDKGDKIWKQNQMVLGHERMIGQNMMGSPAKWYIKYSDIETILLVKGTNTLKGYPPASSQSLNFISIKTTIGNMIDLGTKGTEERQQIATCIVDKIKRSGHGRIAPTRERSTRIKRSAYTSFEGKESELLGELKSLRSQLKKQLKISNTGIIHKEIHRDLNKRKTAQMETLQDGPTIRQYDISKSIPLMITSNSHNTPVAPIERNVAVNAHRITSDHNLSPINWDTTHSAQRVAHKQATECLPKGVNGLTEFPKMPLEKQSLNESHPYIHNTYNQRIKDNDMDSNDGCYHADPTPVKYPINYQPNEEAALAAMHSSYKFVSYADPSMSNKQTGEAPMQSIPRSSNFETMRHLLEQQQWLDFKNKHQRLSRKMTSNIQVDTVPTSTTKQNEFGLNKKDFRGHTHDKKQHATSIPDVNSMMQPRSSSYTDVPFVGEAPVNSSTYRYPNIQREETLANDQQDESSRFTTTFPYGIKLEKSTTNDLGPYFP